MPGHTTNLSKLKRIEITQRVFPEHNGVKLEINNRKKIGNSEMCRN